MPPGKQNNTNNQTNPIAELTRPYTEAAIETIVSIMNDPDVTASTRLNAAESILLRAWGKQDTLDGNAVQQHILDLIAALDGKNEPNFTIVAGSA